MYLKVTNRVTRGYCQSLLNFFLIYVQMHLMRKTAMRSHQTCGRKPVGSSFHLILMKRVLCDSSSIPLTNSFRCRCSVSWKIRRKLIYKQRHNILRAQSKCRWVTWLAGWIVYVRIATSSSCRSLPIWWVISCVKFTSSKVWCRFFCTEKLLVVLFVYDSPGILCLFRFRRGIC